MSIDPEFSRSVLPVAIDMFPLTPVFISCHGAKIAFSGTAPGLGIGVFIEYGEYELAKVVSKVM